MNPLIDWLFSSDNFMPHGHCYLWQPNTLWLNVGSDALIACSYFAAASAQLEQVLNNLINNAIKHHDKPSGAVVLSAATVGDFVEFAVRDDGPGIPPEFHEKLFELFQTLKQRGQAESTGMGLAIVKKLVERHNCRITVHSEGNGAGTEFRFRWPSSPTTLLAEEAAYA